MIYLAKSMTGFGRGEYIGDNYSFKLEIKSVNHRYNDINVKLPRHMSYLEDRIKKKVKENISRGKVDVYISLDYVNESSIEINMDLDLAKEYKNSLEKLKDALNLNDDIKLNNILALSEIIKFDKRELDEDLVWDTLEKALDRAIIDIDSMRSREGQTLKEDMLNKISLIEEELAKVEARTDIVLDEYRLKLENRIGELLDISEEVYEEKIYSELVFYADKSNVDEEITRLKSHNNQFKSILENEDLVGRKLDFLVQEMNREINTIGSKSSDITIATSVVLIKAEIEKIREQIQNIE